MRTLTALAVETIATVFDTGAIWRYFNTQPVTIGSRVMSAGGDLQQQMHSLAMVPEWLSKPFDVNSIQSVLHTVRWQEQDAARIQQALDDYYQAQVYAMMGPDSDRFRSQLTAIADFCHKMPQPLNPLLLHVLCLANCLPMPMMNNFDLRSYDTISDYVDAIHHGMLQTETLLAREPEVAIIEDGDGVVSHDELFEQYAVTGHVLSAELRGADHAPSIEGNKVLLQHAAMTNDVDTFYRIIEGLKSEYDYGKVVAQALIVAASRGHTAFVEAVLNETAINPDSHDGSSFTALHAAAEHNHHQTVRLLLSRGADSFQQYNGRTLFNYALQNAQIDLIDEMLRAHIQHPDVYLGSITRLTSEQTKSTVYQGVLHPAIIENNTAMVALCLQLDFLDNQQDYAQAVATIAANYRNMDATSQINLLRLLPADFSGINRDVYFLSKLDVVASQNMNVAVFGKGKSVIEVLMKYATVQDVTHYINKVLTHQHLTVSQKHKLLYPSYFKKEEAVIAYLFDKGTARQVGEFVSSVCRVAGFTNDQKYRLIWPQGSSKTGGLHQFFASAAGKPKIVSAYLQAMLNSSLSEEVKHKVLKKLLEKKYLTLPINRVKLQPIDLVVLGYIYDSDKSACCLFSSLKEYTHVAAQLKLVGKEALSLPAGDDIAYAFISNKIRLAYFDPHMGSRVNPLARKLEKIAESMGVSLEDGEELVDDKGSVATCGASLVTETSQLYSNALMTRSSSGTWMTMEQKHAEGGDDIRAEAAYLPAACMVY